MLRAVGRLPDRLAAGSLELRRWRPQHVDALMVALEASLAELQPWMPWANPPPTIEDERAVLEASVAAFDAGEEWGYFAIETATGELVGGCGLHRRAGPDTVEIGYWVRSDRTRRGYATAIADALANAAFECLTEVAHVEIRMDKANAASAAVPAKLGFRLAGEETRERLAPGHTGRGLIWVRDREQQDKGTIS